MNYIIKTAQGFVKTIGLVGGEMNEVTEYTNDQEDARRFTQKQLSKMCVRSCLRYRNIVFYIQEDKA